jgi:N-acetylneuraminic acid mutarotase
MMPPELWSRCAERFLARAVAAIGNLFAVMVGDRSFDVHGAHACGIPAIGANWEVGATGELTQARRRPHRYRAYRMVYRGILLVAMLWVAACILSPAASRADRWFQATPMSEPRAAQTATLLPSGNVLVAGGYNGFIENVGGHHTSLDVAELFDPTTGVWSVAAPMNVARSSQTATLLPNGQVLVIGGLEMPGCCTEGTRTAELYDPATNAWTVTPPPPELQEAATATLLQNGEVLVTGTFGPDDDDKAVAGAVLYDPSTNTWAAAAAPNTKRLSGTATLLPNGDVLALGGIQYGENWASEYKDALSSSEIYDPATNRWTTDASMSHPRWGQTATLMPSGDVLIAGGTEETGGASTEAHGISSAELFDPQANSWTAVAPMIVGRQSDTATLLPNGDVLAAGGWGDFGGSPSSFYVLCGVGGCQGASNAELYEPATNTWTPTEAVTTGSEHTATPLPSGAVFVAGGNIEPIGVHELSSAAIYALRYPPDEPSVTAEPAIVPTATTPILRISDTTQSNKTWRAGNALARTAKRPRLAPLGTTFSFTLNERATVHLSFTQRKDRSNVHRRCVAEKSKNHCQLTVTRGTFSVAGQPGKNKISFEGRISHSQKLKPGNYLLAITATSTIGQHAGPSRLSFTIVQ